jgi:ADP-ribose pyrophosphatase
MSHLSLLEVSMDFEIQKREVMYQGRAFEVQRLALRLPNGKIHPFDFIRHPASVTVLPVTEDGQILFVRQYRVGPELQLLELPAGALDEGEDPLTGARRELREETGLDALDLQKLGAAYLAPGYCDEFMTFFIARQLSPAPLDQDEDEFLTIETYSIADALAMARRGEIHDSKTLAALFLAEPGLQNPS